MPEHGRFITNIGGSMVDDLRHMPYCKDHRLGGGVGQTERICQYTNWM